ncbi:MAG: glycoside hydrolase family 5 protein [Prevotella sp.]
MKKTVFILLAIVSAATTKAMEYDMDAHTWCKNVVMGWNLGNALESAGAEWDDTNYCWKNVWETNYNNWETAWGNPKTTKDMIQKVKAEGFNAIRVPVRWVPHADLTTMDINTTWLARVKEVVDWCIDEGLMVIINTHHDLWLEHYPTYAKKTELNEKLKKLWTNIATAFKDYDGRLAFAGTNEVNPLGDWGVTPTQENYDVQNSFNQTFVDAVRATGGNNLKRNLIVQTMRCNPSLGLQYFTVPTDPTEDRLSVEFHYYDPYSYCSGSDGCYYYWGTAYADKGTICPDGNERSLAALFTQIRKTWWDAGLGVVLGEYGCSHHYTTDDQTTQEANQQYYLKCLVGEARQMGFAAFVWDNNAFGNGSEKFGIFNRKNNMSIDAPFFLNGIKEGSMETYVDEVSGEESDPDVGVGGTVIWEGNSALNWDNGLQVKIDKSKFAPFNESATIVVYYTQDASASYEDIQLSYLDTWNQFECKVDDVVIDGNFNPRSHYGTTGATHITAFVIGNSVLTQLKSVGAVIQGYGATLTKVVLIDTPSTGISTLTTDETAKKAIYDLNGKKVKNPRSNNIYIVGGKQRIIY